MMVYISNIFVLHDMIQIRAAVASGMLLLAVFYKVRSQFIPFIVTTIIAFLFHYSAILILPIIITAGGWYFYTASEKQISDNPALGDAIQPGIPKATLILAGNDKQSLTPNISYTS